jgi:hypothetical protein
MDAVSRRYAPLTRRAPSQGRAQPGVSAPLTRRAVQPRLGSRAGGCSAPCPASPSGGEDTLVTLAQRSMSGDLRCTIGVAVVRATSRVLSLPRSIVGSSR